MGRSFRHVTSVQLINHDKKESCVQIDFSQKEVIHRVQVKLECHRRRIYLDERLLRKTSSLFDAANVVSFFPDDLAIIKGSPEKRRHFLDRFIANCSSSFVDLSVRYYRAMKSRNAHLKQYRTKFNPSLLATYNECLVSSGLEIYHCRQKAVADLQGFFCEEFNRLVPGHDTPRLQLIPGFLMKSNETAEFDYLTHLEKVQLSDSQRAMTSVGPHRADLRILLNEQDTRYFASQGQQRTLLLAAKLAELRYLTEKLGLSPILLLDDISSELDQHKISYLFDIIKTMSSQVWISTTGNTFLPELGDIQRLQIINGEIHAL